jgi:hypothetical protein
MSEQPTATVVSWVCHPCGMKYGRRTDPGSASTIHHGRCDVCGQPATVTQPRDYGHLRPEWREEKR